MSFSERTAAIPMMIIERRNTTPTVRRTMALDSRDDFILRLLCLFLLSLYYLLYKTFGLSSLATFFSKFILLFANFILMEWQLSRYKLKILRVSEFVKVGVGSLSCLNLESFGFNILVMTAISFFIHLFI